MHKEPFQGLPTPARELHKTGPRRHVEGRRTLLAGLSRGFFIGKGRFGRVYLFLKYLCEIKNRVPEIINIEIVKIIFNSIINPRSPMFL